MQVGLSLRAGAFVVCAFLATAGSGLAASPVPSPTGSPTPTPTPVPTAKPVYQSMTWREVGPALPGGRVANVAGSSRDANLYYAGAAGGGVWKSIDAGKTWKKMGLEATRTITRLVVDPKNSKHVVVAAQGDVYAPSAERGVYVTFDGGATWTKSLYVSDQAGASDVAIDPTHPNVVYAGIWHFVRKPWTTNSGGSDDGLYKSTDGGRTWTQLSGHGLPDGTLGRIGLAIAPSTGRVYALIEASKGILWRSDDAGANWTLVSNDTLVNQRPFYFSHVVVDPQNADRLYALSAAFSTSSDGGKTFHLAPGSPHGDFHGMWIAPN